MMGYIINNATIVNEGTTSLASVIVSGEKIEKIIIDDDKNKKFCISANQQYSNYTVIDATGLCLIPGVIDEHVHFREPGLTHKADIFTESRAAVAGGVTSFMDMPNTTPQTVTQELLQRKFELAAEKSLANYSFYLGATNDNLAEVMKTDPKQVCGIKVFMGSSTGNMLVDNDLALEALFKEAPCLIATHCEDEDIIKKNTELLKSGNFPASSGLGMTSAAVHPLVRTAEACYRSSARAVAMAEKTGARLHILHISTERELSLFRNDIPLKDKKITAETCPHYLIFSDKDYLEKGFAVKCNPAIKTETDKKALQEALNYGRIDSIGTDHAPHLREEKFTDSYFTAKSGFPSIQNSLDLMLNLYHEGLVSLPRIVQLMCHNPAILYQIERRGFIREGYYADLALVDLNREKRIENADMLYKCGWTPYDGMTAKSQVTHTFVNGKLVYHDGIFENEIKGKQLKFER